MKILQVISNLGNGGAEKFVTELSNELSKENEVIVCSIKYLQDWMIFPKQLNKSIKLISLNKKDGFHLKTYRQLYKLFSIERPDVIHFHLDSTMKYVVPLILFFPGINYIYTIHSNLNTDKINLFRKLNRIKFISSKIKFVCISESICCNFKTEFPALNFCLIENGISQMQTSSKCAEVKKEIETYKSNTETKVFLIIGNYSAPKNFPLIMNVFSKLYANKSNVVLLVIGTDTSLGKREWNKIESLSSPNTFMLGLKNNIQDYMQEIDAFCLCSTFEGLPISILEAYSFGKPVLSTPAGGVPSILKDHINGLLSTDFTVEAYHKIITDFINTSENEITNFRNNNLKDFKNRFTIEKAANKYLLSYKD